VSESARGDRGDDRHSLLTTLENVLNVNESADGDEGTGRPHPLPRDLLEAAEGGVRNFKAANFAEVLWRGYERCKNCTKIASGHIEKN
jgi:hypothetical protein